MVVSKFHALENELFEIFREAPEVYREMMTLLGDRYRNSQFPVLEIPLHVLSDVEARIVRSQGDR